jgi:hypothetical protein
VPSVSVTVFVAPLREKVIVTESPGFLPAMIEVSVSALPIGVPSTRVIVSLVGPHGSGMFGSSAHRTSREH